jgi:protein-disulfide isomerase
MELIMKKGTVLALLLVVLGGGYGLGRLATRDKDNSNSPSAAAAMPTAQGPSDGVDRVRVALEGPIKGPADAKVTIVEFSDFQCPFCSRVVPTVDKIMKDYPKQVRLFFRHNPLPFHNNAPLAAEAAVAAEAQGKFWEMHDKMFANQQALDRAGLEKDAQEIGLDMNKFKTALDTHSGKARVDADLAAAKQIGVQGTPNFYIDGRNVQGAQPYEEFKKVVDDEIARADKLIAKGTAPAMVYAAFMKGAKTSPVAPAAGKGPGEGGEG